MITKTFNSEELETLIILVEARVDNYDYERIKESPQEYSHYILLLDKLKKEQK